MSDREPRVHVVIGGDEYALTMEEARALVVRIETAIDETWGLWIRHKLGLPEREQVDGAGPEHVGSVPGGKGE